MFVRALLLLLLALLAHWPQLTLRDWRGTEGRRLQIAAEMVQSGDWMVPTLGHEPTWAKPPLHYWILAATERLGGGGFVLLRLPAVLGLWGLGLLAMQLLWRPFGAAAGWIAALGIVLAPVLLATAASIEIDPLFAWLTAGSLLLLAHGVAHGRRGSVFAAGAVGGLALLSKGPPYFMFAVGAWLCWWRARGTRFLLPYFAPLLLVPLLYYGPLLLFVADGSQVGGAAGEESLGRLLAMDWSRVLKVPGDWLKAAALLLPLLLWFAVDRRLDRERGEAQALQLRMCRAAVYSAIAVLTVFPHRPTRYMLPIVPLFAAAMAPAVASWAGRAELPAPARAAVRGLGVAGALLLLASPWLPLPFPGSLPALALALALLPLLVRTPPALVAACLCVPLLAAWTVLADQAAFWQYGGRARFDAGRLLRGELDAAGAGGALQTFGHVHGGLLLGAGLLPPGDEMLRRPPQQRFLLHETGGWPPLPALPHYPQRLRLCLPGDVYVLRERRD